VRNVRGGDVHLLGGSCAQVRWRAPGSSLPSPCRCSSTSDNMLLPKWQLPLPPLAADEVSCCLTTCMQVHWSVPDGSYATDPDGPSRWVPYLGGWTALCPMHAPPTHPHPHSHTPTHPHTHTHTHPNTHTHTPTRMHTHTPTHMHARAHTHTNTPCSIRECREMIMALHKQVSLGGGGVSSKTNWCVWWVVWGGRKAACVCRGGVMQAAGEGGKA